MSVTRWTFEDLVLDEEYQFEINPNDDGSPVLAKHVNYQNTCAPDGKTLVFEGRDEPQTGAFSGTILSEDHYDAMVTWFKKRHQIRVTDDLGRQMWIYITKFTPKRVRSAVHPWKHTYSVDYVVLDWPT